MPVGPSLEEEAAFLARERAETGRAAGPAADNGSNGIAGVELPPLEDLVKRIPAPTRQLLDEIFRARFVTVKRVPTTALKG